MKFLFSPAMVLKLALLLFVLFVNTYSFETTTSVLIPDHSTENEDNDESPMFRLFSDAYPKLYDLKIDPDLENFTFKGSVDILVFVKTPRYDLQLHSKEITISSLKVKQGTQTLKTDYDVSSRMEMLFISFFKQLEENSEISISIQFSGKLKDNMKGFYRSSYDVNGVKKWLAVTSFKPTFARQSFPCFDEPQFKTPFTISVARNANQKSLSNMPLHKTINENGKLWDIYEQSPPIATYQVAFTVFELSKNEEFGIINIWAKDNAIQHATHYTLNEAKKLLKILEEFTEIPYKLSKLDIVGIPDMQMAQVENFGISIYREQYVIIDENRSATLHKVSTTGALCHGLSHYWFGGLMTPTKWNYLWLSEGFATYFAYFATASVHPEWELDQLFVLELVQPTLWNDKTYNTDMITSITRPNQLIRGAINFKKVASAIRMLEHIMSTKSFRNMITHYFIEGQHKHNGHVTPEFFYEILENQVKRDSIDLPPQITITDIMKTWIKNIGYPLITIKRDLNTKKVTFQQSVYQSPRSPNSSPNQRWIVPLTYATKSVPTFSNLQPSLWSSSSAEVELPVKIDNNDWILCNLQHSGYYRVNYDNHSWNLLIEQLRQDIRSIPPLNRAQMIDDAFTLAEDGQLSYYIPIQLANLLENDTQVVPWISAAFHLDRLYSRFADTPYQLQFYLFIRNIIYRSILDRVDFKLAGETESVLEKIARTKIYLLLCKLNLPTCITPSMEEYQDHYKDISLVHPDRKPIVYCAMLYDNGTASHEWDLLWEMYEKTKNSYDKNVILTAFGCARSETPIVRALARLSDGIRKQDRKHLINALSFSSTSVTAALKFVKQKISATAYRLDEDTKFILQSILETVEPWIQIEKHVKLLKTIEAELNELTESDASYKDLRTQIQKISQTGSKNLRELDTKAYHLAKIINQVRGTAPPKLLHDTSNFDGNNIANVGMNMFSVVYIILLLFTLTTLFFYCCIRQRLRNLQLI